MSKELIDFVLGSTIVKMAKKYCKRHKGYWNSKVKNPVRCPRCTSPYWDKPYVRKAKK